MEDDRIDLGCPHRIQRYSRIGGHFERRAVGIFYRTVLCQAPARKGIAGAREAVLRQGDRGFGRRG